MLSLMVFEYIRSVNHIDFPLEFCKDVFFESFVQYYS